MSGAAELEVILPRHLFLLDHRISERPVLPAVEVLRVMAAALLARRPDVDVTVVRSARFMHLIPLSERDEPRQGSYKTTFRIEDLGEGLVRTELLIIFVSKSGIRRSRPCAEAVFGGGPVPSGQAPDLLLPPFGLPWDVACAPQGICFRIPASRVYPELIMMGPAFQNLKGDLLLTSTGAMSRVFAPQGLSIDGEPASCLLGSPFPLDAAFQLASLWIRRYVNRITIPVGFESRSVRAPCLPGETYLCMVMPHAHSQAARHDEPPLLDVWIMDEQGALREAVSGLCMKGVRGLPAPSDRGSKDAAWMTSGPETDPLASLGEGLLGLSVVEIAALAPFAPKALAPEELDRFDAQSSRRRSSFLAARVALKQLGRMLCPELSRRNADELLTTSPMDRRPCLALGRNKLAPYVSAAHDSRFAVAVAARSPVGVDVELISEKALRVQTLFMTESERCLVERSTMGAKAAATRVWTVKEAACKAMNFPLADAFNRVTVTQTGPASCLFRFDGKELKCRLAEEDGHVFALVLL